MRGAGCALAARVDRRSAGGRNGTAAPLPHADSMRHPAAAAALVTAHAPVAAPPMCHVIAT
jgi:hypothetical protein